MLEISPWSQRDGLDMVRFVFVNTHTHTKSVRDVNTIEAML